MKNTKQEVINLEYGKLPPQATEIEEVLLGSLMVESKAFSEISDFLKAEHFYHPAHAIIYRIIEKLAFENQPTDFIMVANRAKQENVIDEIGGAYYITFLSTKVNSGANIEKYARIVFQKFLMREAIRISNEVLSMAYSDTDIDDILTFASKSYQDITTFTNGSIITMFDAVNEMRKNVIKNSGQQNKTGFATGFNTFDERSGGMQKSDLIIIAAETSQGKTSLALTMCDNIAEAGGKMAIYSLEMRATQLAARFTSYHTGIPANEILYGKFNNSRFEQLDNGLRKLINYEIYIDEKSTSTIESILQSIRGIKKQNNIDGVVVDYLQLVSTTEKGMNKEQQTAYITRSLKNIAKELDIFVIALSQLSRDSASPIPTLKRLRDSGQIEEAADVCILIYRPEQVGRSSFPEPFENSDVAGNAMIDIAKGRNIGTFKFLAGFDKSTTHFYEKDEYGFSSFLRNNDDPFN